MADPMEMNSHQETEPLNNPDAAFGTYNQWNETSGSSHKRAATFGFLLAVAIVAGAVIAWIVVFTPGTFGCGTLSEKICKDYKPDEFFDAKKVNLVVSDVKANNHIFTSKIVLKDNFTTAEPELIKSIQEQLNVTSLDGYNIYYMIHLNTSISSTERCEIGGMYCEASKQKKDAKNYTTNLALRPLVGDTKNPYDLPDYKPEAQYLTSQVDQLVTKVDELETLLKTPEGKTIVVLVGKYGVDRVNELAQSLLLNRGTSFPDAWKDMKGKNVAVVPFIHSVLWYCVHLEVNGKTPNCSNVIKEEKDYPFKPNLPDVNVSDKVIVKSSLRSSMGEN